MGWILNKKPETPIFKNPKYIRKLIFTDRQNIEYIVDDDPIENHIIGVQPTYKDFIREGLNPNVEDNKNVYGIAKTLEPLTTRINKMKESIDNAGLSLQALKEKALADIEAHKQATAAKEESTPQGGAQDDPNK